MIGIIDYGAGNLLSVRKALDYLNKDVFIIKNKEDFNKADKIILPGVGAFEAAINKLEKSEMLDELKNWISNDKPFLGICLGMQLLFNTSEESKNIEGLNIFNGDSLKFEKYKVPQIGWNNVSIENKESKLFHDFENNEPENNTYFYFLHSFYVKANDESIILTTTNYGLKYTSSVSRGNIYAVQFHPEKSGEIGLKLLNNWVELC